MSRSPRHRRPLIEALEPRLLFSATADIAVFDDGASDGQYLAHAAEQVDLVSIYMPSEPFIMESQASNFELQADLPSSENPAITTLVFVDTAVDNYVTLVDDIRARLDGDAVAIVYLDSTRDGLGQISDYLTGVSGISAIHVISHGIAGNLQLGTQVLNENNIDQFKQQLMGWQNALGADADILLYGCDLAANQSGVNFLRQLSDLTGADVAASNDLTGNSHADADWLLEEKIGIVETESLFAANQPMEWQGTLADVTYVNIPAANNPATVSSTNHVGQSIQYPGGNYTVDQISIQLLKNPGAAVQTITVELRDDWNGAVRATASISSASLTDTFQWVNFDFAETNLTVDTVYWIRVSSTGTDGLISAAYQIGNSYNNGLYYENGNGDAGRELALRVSNSDGINAAPTVANPIANQSVTEGTMLNYSFPSNSFDDPDGDNLSYTAKLANGDPLPAWLTFNQATRTFSGVADDGNVGIIDIRVTATDGNGLSVFDDFNLTINNLPEAPFIVNPIPDQVASGFTPFSYQFTAFNEASPVFADPEGDSITGYRATLADGSSLPGWLNFDSATRTFSGTPTNTDAGTVSIKLYATDSTGLETATPDQFDIVISATANDAPVNTVPGAQSTNEDIALVFNLANGNQIQIADADAVSGSVQVTLGVANGVLTLAGTAGLSFTTGDGTNDAALVFTGTVANINAALATLTYTPTANYSGADTLSIVTNDLGNSGTGGAKSDSDTVAITVNAVNDAPINTVPGAQTATEDTAFVFSSGNSNQIQINDVDAGSSSMQVTLSVTNGTLTLAGVTGLSFTTGDGTADSSVVFSGTRTDLNNALATLTFNPTANYTGGAVLSLTTSDLGNTGSGGTLTDSDTVNITVNAANDAPTVANIIPNQNATEDTVFNFQFAANTFNDIDAGNTLVYSAQLAGGGSLPGWLSFNAATRTFSGTPSNANVGTVSIDVIASDGNGGTVTDTFDIVVANTNDAPTVANAIPNQNATEDSAFSFQFAANTFNDPDAVSSLTYTAQLAGGGVLPAWLTFNDATRTFSGTPANGDVGTISVRVTADDGLGGTVSDTFDVAIANTNDAPTVANAIPNQAATENTLFNFSFAINTFNDPDTGDTLTYSAQLAGGGALPAWLNFDSATRTFSGMPTNSDVGTVSLDVIASDGNGGLVTDTFNIVIGNVDDSPVLAIPIPNQNATEDVAFNFQFAAGTFTDPDVGDVLTYSAEMADGSPLLPWLNFDPATRTFSGTPANGDVGTISIKVTAADLNGGPVATDTFDIVIANTNDAPTIANVIADQNATEDAAFNFTFAANTFSDQDISNTLTYSAQLAGGGALPVWLSFDAVTRTFSGTPLNVHVGTVSIDVIASDGNGGSVTETFALVVANTNDAPSVDNVIPNQNATQNIAFNFQFAANTFSDVDGNTLTYSAQLLGGGALPAWLSFDSATRTFSGTPANGDVGTLSIDVTANDGNGGTVMDTFDIVIANANDAPTVVITPTDYNATEQVAINLHGTGISVADVDGDTLTITLTGEGSNSNLAATVGTTGVVIVSGVNTNTLILSGTAAQLNDLFAGNNGSILTYRLSGDTPVATRLLTISASDGSLSGNDTATITIAAVNDGPENGVPGVQSINEDTALVFSADNGNQIQVNDLDAGSSDLEVTLSVTNGTLTLAGVAGLAFITGDGTADSSLVFRGTQTDINAALATLTFNPTANFNGAAVLTITTSDLGNTGTGGTLTDSDNINITINAANDAPTVANAIPNQNAIEDAAFNFQFAVGAFADTDLDALIYTAQLAGGGALPTWLSFDAATHTFSGTPANGDVGTVSIDVIADDGNGGTVTDTFNIVVANSNDAPTVTNAIANQNATEDTAFNFQFAANVFSDPDVSDTLTYTAQLAGGGALPAWLSFDAATRTFSGVPANSDLGTVSIDVIADDGNGGTVTDTFNIVIANSNDAPTVANAIADQNATEDAAFNFQFAANVFADPDVSDTLTYTAQLAGGGALPAWLSFDSITRTFSGTPMNGDVGTVSIDVIADDGNGGTVTDTFNIVVANSNDAPTVANAIADQNATEDAAFNFQFAVNVFADPDVSDTLTYTAQLAGGGALPAWLSFDAATRTFSGTPTNSDLGIVSIDVIADDGNGGTVTDTFNIVIANANDIPTIANAIPNQNATEDAAFNFQFAANVFADPDVSDTLTYTAQLAGGGALPAWLSFDSVTRTFSGTPMNGDVGTVSIDVIADDGNGGTVTDTFNVVIANSNDAPTVANTIANQNATEDTAFNFQFAANVFADPDVGDTLTYTAQLAGGGALPTWLNFDSITRTFSGTPANSDLGTVSIDVIADDGNGGTVTDTFNIVIANSNDAPTVANAIANQNATEDTAFNFQFAANVFADPDVSDTLIYSAQLAGGGALPAWLSFDPVTRTFSGTPTNSDLGIVSIDVIADDGNGGTVTDTFNIVIANANDVPTIANAIPNQNATEDAAFNFQFAANVFADPDVSDTLTYTAQLAGGGALPAWLSFDSVTRTFSGIPMNGDVGTVSIDVIADDGNGGTVTDTFNVVIANSNDAPTVANTIANQNATEDFAFNFQFAANVFADSDVGDTLTYTAQLAGGGALPAWLSFDAITRTFSGTPTNSDLGTVSIDVIADDGNGGTVTDTFNVVVGNTNDAPTVANAIANQNATEDTVFNFQFAANVFADPDVGDTLTYTAQLAGGGALPAWLSFDAATRTFSGTPENGDVGTVSIDVIAGDGNGGTIADTFSIVIANTNDAPTVSNPIANQNATEDAAFNFQFAANVFADPDVSDTLTYTAQLAGGGALPAWLNFDAATRTFSGTPLNGDVGTVSIDVIANDGNGGAVTDTFNIVIANSNDAPTVANAITNQNATEDAAFNFQFAANVFADPDVSDTLTYTAQLAGGGALPAWLSFDSVTRTFSGTPTNNDTGDISILIIASDGLANTSTQFQLTVISDNDVPGTSGFLPINNVEDAASDTVDLFAAFSDEESPANQLQYFVVSNSNPALVNGATIDATTGKLQLNYGANQFGSCDLVIRAQDAQGASVETSLRVNIESVNDTPTSAGIADILVQAGASPQQMNLHAVFSDIEDGAQLRYLLIGNTNPGVVTYVQMDPATGMMTLAFSSSAGGESIITLRAIDADGAWQDTQFKVTVSALDTDIDIPVTPDEPGNIPPAIPPITPPTEPPTAEIPVTNPPAGGGSQVDEPFLPANPEDTIDTNLPGTGNVGSADVITEDDNGRAEFTYVNDQSSRDYARATEMLSGANVSVTLLTVSTSLISLITPDVGFAPWETEDFDNEVRRVRAQMDEALEEEQDRKAIVAGLTFSVTTGLLVWSLRASSLLLTMMSMLPLWRGLDPLPILDEVNKKKKELEQQRKDRVREDKSAKEVGYLFDHAQNKESRP